MAIDTREKRASVAGIGVPLLPEPTPNAAKDQEWRQEVGWGYSGILASGAGPAPTRRPWYGPVLKSMSGRGG